MRMFMAAAVCMNGCARVPSFIANFARRCPTTSGHSLIGSWSRRSPSLKPPRTVERPSSATSIILRACRTRAFRVQRALFSVRQHSSCWGIHSSGGAPTSLDGSWATLRQVNAGIGVREPPRKLGVVEQAVEPSSAEPIEKTRSFFSVRSTERLLGRCVSGVEQAEHEIRKFLILPDNRKSCRRVAGQSIVSASLCVPLPKSGCQLHRILDCHVHALSACGSHEMSGIADEKDAAALHRLTDQDPKIENVALNQSPLDKRTLPNNLQTILQFRPDTVVRPVIQPVAV